MKITVMAPTLTYALTAVNPHALTEDHTPILNCVALQVIDGRLYVSATDRHTVGVAHLPTVAPSDAEFKAIIDLASARQLLQIVKLAQAEVGKLVETEITLTVEKEHLVIGTQWKNHMLRLRNSEQDVPALLWRTYLPPFIDDAIGDARTGFCPTNLAKFVKAMPYKDATMVTYQTKGTKPMFVAVGDSFFGFAAPRKTDLGHIEMALPQALGGTRPNTEAEEVEAKARAVVKAEIARVAGAPTPPSDDDKPDLAGKKPATVRPAAKAAAKTPSEKEYDRDKRFYGRQAAKAATKAAPRKAAAKKVTPRKVA